MTTLRTGRVSPRARASFSTALPAVIRIAAHRAMDWWARRRAMSILSSLDDRMLEDIGLRRMRGRSVERIDELGDRS